MRIHVYIHIGRIQRNEDVDGKGVQAYSQVYAYINRHRDIRLLNLQKKEKGKKKVVMDTEPNPKHAARAEQVEKRVEKKAYTHDTDSQKQANRQGRCVRETEAIIGKAPRLGIHTLE